MQISELKHKIKENKKYRYGAIALGVLILIVAWIFINNLLAPRVPKIPYKWKDKIVAYWAFEEDQGQVAKDITTNYNDLRLGSSPGADDSDPEWVDGRKGKALKFDGPDYAIAVYDDRFDLEREVSIEAWVSPKPSSLKRTLWIPGWRYRKIIVLDNKQRKSFDQAQIKINIDTKSLIAQHKMKSNCQDLRFTDSDKTTTLNWFLQQGCNSSSTEIWVEIPSIEAWEKKPIYVYYGNFETGPGSNFRNTMEVPPVTGWSWPSKELPSEEKANSIAVTSKNEIIAAGYRADRFSKELEWKVVRLNSKGRSTWYRIIDPSSKSDQVTSVAIDSQDDIILGGFGYSLGNSQWRVRKIGPGGWSYNSNPSSKTDQISSVAVDSQDNIIAAGFDYSKGNSQWRVEKLNSNGKKVWTYTSNPSDGPDLINSVAIDSQDNIILGGTDKKKGNDQWKLVKLNPKGESLLTYSLNISEGSDLINSVAVDSQDNIILGGFDFRPGNFRWRLIKLNPNGEMLWSYNSNPSSKTDQISSVAVDSQDNIIAAGFDYSKGNSQWRVEKLNSNGKKVWTYTSNPSDGPDLINSVAIDSERNIVLGGLDNLFGESRFRIEKISERKYYDLKPSYSLSKPRTPSVFPSNLVVAKLNSYSIRADSQQALGSVNENVVSAPLQLSKSGWTHLVLTFDGSQQKLYLDGKLKASQALTGRISSNFNNIILGYNFAGIIDEVKIYNRALTTDQVEELYQQED